MSHTNLTAARRRKNRDGLLDFFGVPPLTEAAERMPRMPRNPRSGLSPRRHDDRAGILEDLGMTADELRESLDRADLSPRSPGFGAHTDGEVPRPTGPGAVGGTDVNERRREMLRRRGAAREVLLGRGDGGSTGDVDAPDAPVGEAFWRDVEARATAATELSEAYGGSSRSLAALRAAQRLHDVTERVCRCSEGGDADERHCGCGAACSMAQRNLTRHRDAAGLRETDRGGTGPLRDWDGDLAA